MPSEASRRRAVALILAAAALLAVFIALWPDWTLRYIHALAWPVVALLAIAVFGPALVRRVPALNALHLPGGVTATFTEQHTIDLDFADDFPVPLGPPEDMPVPWEAPGDTDDAAAALAAAKQQTESLTLIGGGLAITVGAYQFQLTFLRWLSEAEDGLTIAASEQQLTSLIEVHWAADASTWDVSQLLAWLVQTDAIVLSADGNYRITDLGRMVLRILDSPDFFVAPKLF